MKHGQDNLQNTSSHKTSLWKKLSQWLMFVLMASPVVAEEEKWDIQVVPFEQLPERAQAFVREYFHLAQVAHVVKDYEFYESEYLVYLKGNGRLEFDGEGQWTQMEFTRSSLPLEVLPLEIRTYLAEHYPQVKVEMMEREQEGFELRLSTGRQLKFGKNGRLLWERNF